MFKKLEDTSLLNEITSRLDDIVFISNVLLQGELVLSRRLASIEDLEHVLDEVCRDKICYVHIRFYDINNEEIGELRIFVYNGVVLGAILGIGTETFKGIEGLDSIGKISDKGVSSIKAVVYAINDKVLSDRDRDLLLKAIEEIKKPSKKEVKERVEEEKEAPEEKPKNTIMRKLEEIGVPVVNIVLAEGKKYTILDIICDEDQDIPDPKNIMLAAIKYFLEQARGEKYMGKIKITVHHRKTYSETFDIGGEADVYILIGSIPEVVWKHNLFINKYKYKLRGKRLELSLVLQRSGIYSTINIRDIVRIIYDKVKDKWEGELVIKAKIGTWGLEAKYPE